MTQQSGNPAQNGSNGLCSNAVNYQKYITPLSENRTPSTVAALVELSAKMPPDTIALGVGSPSTAIPPFERIQVTLKDGTKLTIEGDKLKTVLSYLPTKGYTPLHNLLKEFQNRAHGPQDWTKKELMITGGSQEAIYKATMMLLKPGDPLLVNNPLYSGYHELIKPMNIECMCVNTDEHGLRPDLLIKVLEERKQMPHKKMPKALYITPVGSNPTGTLLTDERKAQIYKIAQQYDLIILEDDPYYFVHFLDKDPVSFLSIDTDDRVIRFDSFSKTLSAGMRLGYATGPKYFMEKMELHQEVSTMHCSGVSQAIAYETLAAWGYEGYQKFLITTRAFYKDRRDIMLRAAEKYLTGLATWDIPQAGMFMWLKLTEPVKDFKHLLLVQCVEHKLLVTPGYAFNVDANDTNNYIRMSYSLATHEQVDQAMKILGRLIRENSTR